MDELEDPKETPEEVAANFTCAMFETPQDVLKGARHMVCLYVSFLGVNSYCNLKAMCSSFL